MKTYHWLRSALAGCGTLSLAGCLNPYALNISEIDYYSPQSTGVIQVTDAKLYSREALINERRDEAEYLAGLLKDSRKIQFAPQIMREVEYISAISASLGLSFDPGAGRAYESDLATTRTQQEINELSLQLQLESLKRDAELLRETFAARTVPASDPLAAEIAASDSTSDVTAPGTAELLTAINALTSRLETRLGQTVAGPRAANAAVDPSDLFLDRAAYRDLIKSAMSAERLDDLHDKNGNALMRFHFGATVLPPDRDKMDTLGMLRMQVKKPVLTDDDIAELYRLWLSFINQHYNLTSLQAAPQDQVTDPATNSLVPAPQSGSVATKTFIPNPRYYLLESDTNLFETVSFALPRTKADYGNCLFFEGGVSAATDDCIWVYIAVPLSDPDAKLKIDEIAGDVLADAYSQRLAMETAIEKGVGDPLITEEARDNLGVCKDRGGLYATQEVANARAILKTEAALREAYRNLLSIVISSELDAHQAVFLRESFSELVLLFDASRRLVNKAAGNDDRCKAPSIRRSRDIAVPKLFSDEIKKLLAAEANVRIYDVSPRERAQQISTVTRAAEAINVAAAIAGRLPQSGIGFDAQSAFARSASGKADARERAPLVVSFAEPKYSDIASPRATKKKSEVAFGWLLGPRVVVHPEEKELQLSHYTAPYELTADLSMPGWWPYVDLRVQTAWTPDWRQGVGSTMTMNFTPLEEGAAPLGRTLRVPLAPNASDMSSLTNALILRGSSFATSLYPTITAIIPSEVSACAGTTTLLIEGENIWRSEKVVVGGREYSGSRVRVTPDMNGVLVDIDARALPQAKTHVNLGGNADIDVYAMNQDGEARGRFILRHLKADGTCSGQLPKPTVPKITKITLPKVSVCDPKPQFIIAGTNLDKAASVSLGAIGGKVTAKTPTRVSVEFPPIKQKLAGIDKATLRLMVGKTPLEQEIDVITPAKECLK